MCSFCGRGQALFWHKSRGLTVHSTGVLQGGVPLGQACPYRATATVMRSIRAWLAPHPPQRQLEDGARHHGAGVPGCGTTHRVGCSHNAGLPTTWGQRTRVLDYPQVGATLGWGLPTVRGATPGLLKWSNECEQSIAIRV